jgi:hypothetical protein
MSDVFAKLGLAPDASAQEIAEAITCRTCRHTRRCETACPPLVESRRLLAAYGQRERAAAERTMQSRMTCGVRNYSRRVSRHDYFNWIAVSDLYGFGSTEARKWCEENGIDPDSTDPTAVLQKGGENHDR